LPVIKHYNLKGKVRKVMWSCKEDNRVCILEGICCSACIMEHYVLVVKCLKSIL
ncbi:hypothetical protein B296_00043780, partial [Ensete ventricosum]